jgi:PAS domain S-box-containing protein
MTSAVSVTVLLLFTPKEASGNMPGVSFTRNLSQTSILLENLYYIYDDVMLIDIKGNQIRHVVLDTGQEHSTFDLRLKFFRYAKERIYPRDYERFTAFSDPETLSKRISESERSMLRAFFRTREDTGNYVWKEYAFMRIPKMKADVALMTVRTIDTKDVDIVLRSENEKTGLQYQSSYSDEAADDITKEKALLWDNIVQHSTLNFFWKDIHRRFLGASQSFLDYYGLDSVNDIIGKTDEDMTWHVDEDTYKNEEYDVLRSGKTSKYYPEKCISRGINRTIMATKHPLYKGGEIIGLAGFFIDADELNQANGKADLIPIIDPVTGLNNTRGIMEALTWYSENYRMRGKDFAVIAVDIPELPRLLQAYGDDFNKKILRALANAVLDVMKNRYIIDHLPVGAYIVRPDRTIIYWNHAAEEITGYHKEEMIDKTCPETCLSHMDKNGMPLCELLCPLLRSIETGETDKRKMWALHKDNYRILLDTMLVPIRGKDGRMLLRQSCSSVSPLNITAKIW